MINKVFSTLSCICLIVQAIFLFTTPDPEAVGTLIGQEIGICIFGLLFIELTEKAIKINPIQRHDLMACININCLTACIIYGLPGVIYAIYRSKNNDHIPVLRSLSSCVIAIIFAISMIISTLEDSERILAWLPIIIAVTTFIAAATSEYIRVKSLGKFILNRINTLELELDRIFAENIMLKKRIKELEQEKL